LKATFIWLLSCLPVLAPANLLSMISVDSTNHIHVSESGFEALDFLTNENQPPELIFLETNMPAMNGWEFLEDYNKLSVEQKAEVIIIMLTTLLNPADKKRSEKIPGINGFETKPLTREKLIKILERHFPHVKEGK
jgi:CheY-like chemotaxis protein